MALKQLRTEMDGLFHSTPAAYSRLWPTARRTLDLLLQREIARDRGDEEGVRWIEDELRAIRCYDPDGFVAGADEAYKIIGYVERFTESVRR